MRLKKPLEIPWGEDLLKDDCRLALWLEMQTIVLGSDIYRLSPTVTLELMSVMMANTERGDLLNPDKTEFKYLDVHETWGEPWARENMRNFLRQNENGGPEIPCTRPNRLRLVWIFTRIHPQFARHIEI